jgi:hypothetical protein
LKIRLEAEHDVRADLIVVTNLPTADDTGLPDAGVPCPIAGRPAER